MSESIFPEIKILRCPPPFEGVARAIKRVKDLGRVTELCLSEHHAEAPEHPRPGEIGGVAITGYLAADNPEQ